jgi:hypothetical protein
MTRGRGFNSRYPDNNYGFFNGTLHVFRVPAPFMFKTSTSPDCPSRLSHEDGLFGFSF